MFIIDDSPTLVWYMWLAGLHTIYSIEEHPAKDKYKARGVLLWLGSLLIPQQIAKKNRKKEISLLCEPPGIISTCGWHILAIQCLGSLLTP